MNIKRGLLIAAATTTVLAGALAAVTYVPADADGADSQVAANEAPAAKADGTAKTPGTENDWYRGGYYGHRGWDRGWGPGYRGNWGWGPGYHGRRYWW